MSGPIQGDCFRTDLMFLPPLNNNQRFPLVLYIKLKLCNSKFRNFQYLSSPLQNSLQFTATEYISKASSLFLHCFPSGFYSNLSSNSILKSCVIIQPCILTMHRGPLDPSSIRMLAGKVGLYGQVKCCSECVALFIYLRTQTEPHILSTILKVELLREVVT
jgi:hypothetical protein